MHNSTTFMSNLSFKSKILYKFDPVDRIMAVDAHNLCLSKNMKNVQNISTEKISFFSAVKNCCILHGRVFVMAFKGISQKGMVFNGNRAADHAFVLAFYPNFRGSSHLSLNIYLFDKLYNTIQYNTIQYNTIQYNTIQYNTIQYNSIQYITIQYNTMQYKEFTNWDPERSLLDLSKSVSHLTSLCRIWCEIPKKCVSLMSLLGKKCSFGLNCAQVQLKPAFAATEAS